MKYLMLAPLALLGIVLALPAQTYYSPNTYYSPRQCRVCPEQSSYTHYQPYHAGHHREIVRLIDVAQINPAYTSSYSPDGYDAATQQAIKAQIGLLSQQIDTLTQRLSKPIPPTMPPATAPTPAPQPGAKAPTPAPHEIVPPGVNPSAIGLAVLNAKCAICHQDGKLPPDQKFTLLDVKGALVPLTDKQRLRVILKTYSGQMPPPNNTKGIPAVTDAEFAAIAALLQPGS